MHFLQMWSDGMQRMTPFVLGMPLLLIPFIIAEQLRPAERRPGVRDYLFNIALAITTAYITLPVSIAVGTASSLLRCCSILPHSQVHRIHHSVDPQHYDCNFADALPIFDIIFGTYRRPERDKFPSTGLGPTHHTPSSVWRAQIDPVIRVVRRWLA